MLSHKLEIYRGNQSVKGNSKEKDFEIEVNDDFVTVSLKRLNHSNMFQSKTFKVEQDVLVIVHSISSNLYTVELDWLWREPTKIEGLTLRQAEELKQLVEQLAQSKLNLDSQILNLKGIKIGDQIWSDQNIDLDIGKECCYPTRNGEQLITLGRLYTYEGAKRASDLYKNWRIPTTKDYIDLLSFFPNNGWKEITDRLNFNFCGFSSKRFSKEKLDKFLNQNPALKTPNCGLYWTNDIMGFNDSSGLPKSVKYLMLNNISKKVYFKESQCSNQNMFSLRLIRDN